MSDASRQAPGEHDIDRYRSNLRDEVDGAALYHLLAEAERDPALKDVYRRLAATEERHGAIWAGRLQAAGVAVPEYRPSFRVRSLGWLARRFGTQAVAPIAARMEAGAVDMYDAQPEAVAHAMPADERSHARVFQELARPGSMGAVGPAITAIEGRHRLVSGNALRAAVLGANDGLVSNLSLVMGVAGADPGRDVVILTGLAGLLAGSLSMALGEWISVQSSAEAFERQIAVERDELEMVPDEEQEELSLIYQAKGIPPDLADALAERIIANPRVALDTLAREELGMAPDEVGNPFVAAVTSFLTFAVGALLPILPWLFAGGLTGIVLSAAASGVGLFLVGAAITLYTGRGLLFSGMRMLIFGLAAAAVTFGIGAAIGSAAGI